MAETGSWRDRAVSAWRVAGLGARLSELLDIDVDPATITSTQNGSQVVLDGITFAHNHSTGALGVTVPCPRCKKLKPMLTVETFTDLGAALDGLCRDCTFLAHAGIAAPQAATRM